MASIYFFFVVQTLIILCLAISIRNLKRSLRKGQDKAMAFIKKADVRLHELYFVSRSTNSLQNLPAPLLQVPLANESGVVVSTKKLNIPGLEAAYNGAIFREDEKYSIFFRFDIPFCGVNHKISYSSQIGHIGLGKNLEPEGTSFTILETGSAYAEDARVFSHKGQQYLLFNDLLPVKKGKMRGLRLGALDKNTLCFTHINSFKASKEHAMHLGRIEKNWTPFSHEDGIYFLHTISPLKLIYLSDSANGFFKVLTPGDFKSSPLDWTKKWGALRGGTQAELIDGEYLTFFHSSFEDMKGIRWYTMGACCFEKNFPFRMTKISPYPIVCKGMYETLMIDTAHPEVRSIYPVSFVYESKKDIIHVSCGENDSAIKILTLDKKRLFTSLKDLY